MDFETEVKLTIYRMVSENVFQILWLFPQKWMFLKKRSGKPSKN
jgi:hypothetical protein